ncbi:MAG: prepilin-type N-terminal cleavage/methylation domain-containing protein [Candidatus Hydrogenedentota bacterium]
MKDLKIHKHQKGITLLELLIPITILGMFFVGAFALKNTIKSLFIKNNDLIIAYDLGRDLREEIITSYIDGYSFPTHSHLKSL